MMMTEKSKVRECTSVSSWSKPTVSPILFPCQMCVLARATTGMAGWCRRLGAWPSGAHACTHPGCSCVPAKSSSGCEGGGGAGRPEVGWNMCVHVCVCGSCSLHAPGSVAVTRQTEDVCLRSSSPKGSCMSTASLLTWRFSQSNIQLLCKEKFIWF